MRLALALLLVLAQDDPEALIKRLASDDLASRESAAAALKKLGDRARPHLERAAADADAELAGRAKRLLRVIGVMGSLTPRLREALPGLEDRLADGDAHTWTEALLEAASRGEGHLPRHPSLRRADWIGLAARALEGAADDDERADVCELIARHRLPVPHEPLARLTTSEDGVVQRNAHDALLALRAHAAVPALLRILTEEKEVDTDVAIGALVELLPAREDILPLLEHGRPATRSAALEVATRLGFTTEKIVGAMISDRAESVRERALRSARERGYRGLIPSIEAALENSGGTRREAIEALAGLDSRGSIAKILPHLDDADIAVRIAAMRALGELQAREALPRLLAALETDKGTMGLRDAAVSAVGAFDGDEVRRALQAVLKRPRGMERYSAALALTSREDAASVDNVLPLLSAEWPQLSCWIVQNLMSFERTRVLREITSQLEDADPQSHLFLATFLARNGVREIAPAFERLLKHRSEMLRGTAVECLSAIHPTAHSAAIAACVGDADAGVREEAAAALGRTRSTAHLPALRKLMNEDPEVFVRTTAGVSIARIAGADALEELRALLKRTPERAFVVGEALCMIGSPEGVRPVLDFVEVRPDLGQVLLAKLNAVRQPAAWRKLDTGLVERRPRESMRDLLSRIAAEAGLELRITEGSLRREKTAFGPLFEEETSDDREQSATLLQALLTIMRHTTYAFILDEGVLRVLPKDAALDEWLKWRDSLK